MPQPARFLALNLNTETHTIGEVSTAEQHSGVNTTAMPKLNCSAGRHGAHPSEVLVGGRTTALHRPVNDNPGRG